MPVVSESFVVEPTIIFKLEEGADLDDILRRAVNALGHFEGESFTPGSRRAAAFMRGELSALRISLVHPRYTDETGYPNSWLSVHVTGLKTRGIGKLFLGIHMGRPGEQIDLEWKVALEVGPRLIVQFAPTLAFINGRLIDFESSTFPPDEPIPGSVLPDVFTPWTFFDAANLDKGTEDKLKSLPAAASGPLGNGWFVQAVESLQDSPSSAFLDSLKTLADKPITYRGPELSEE